MKSSTTTTKAEESPRIIIFDRSGDLMLKVGSEDKEIKYFKVSSKALSLASPVWSAMLNPQNPFLEASASGMLLLPDDNPKALSILLYLIHDQFAKIDFSVGLQALHDLVFLCDKYNTVDLVRPWMSRWQKHFSSPLFDPKWLVVGWTFRDRIMYRDATQEVYLRCWPNESGNLVTPAGSLEDIVLPPGALNAIKLAREQTVVAIIRECDSLVKRYDEAFRNDLPVCKGFYNREACDALTFGCIVAGLRSVISWSRNIEGDRVNDSIWSLRAGILNMPDHVYPSVGSDTYDHSSCKYLADFEQKIYNIIHAETTKKKLLESYDSHSARQDPDVIKMEK